MKQVKRRIGRLVGVILGIALLIPGIAPVWAAEVELSADLGVGRLETQNVAGPGPKTEEGSDFKGALLGLGWEHKNFRVEFEYLKADLDKPVAGADENTLRDLRLGYRFYDADGLRMSVLGSYIDERCGSFEAHGPALGLGLEYAFNPHWSVNGRMGYSPFEVKVKNGLAEYKDATLLPVAVGLKYQINDNWSVHTSYRYYGFSGKIGSTSVTSEVDLVSAGVSYRFGARKKGKSESAASPSPEASPVQERQERINQFLQPVFFDLDCDRIRPDQVGVLQKNLQLLKANPDLNIIVAGHADQPGSPDYNRDLSERRAGQVKEWLVQHGIREGRISVYAYGKENPYRDKVKSRDWESDRWVDIFVTDEKPTREAGMRI